MEAGTLATRLKCCLTRLLDERRDERAAFRQSACGDEDDSGEVESLLARDG